MRAYTEKMSCRRIVALGGFLGIAAATWIWGAEGAPPTRVLPPGGQTQVTPTANPEVARPAPARPGLSWEAADAFVQKTADLDRRFREGKFRGATPIELSESELNSYVSLTMGTKLPNTVSGIKARFLPGRIVVEGTVDLDRVRDGMGFLSPWNPLRLLSGMTPVVADAALVTEAGVGQVSPQEMSLGALPIPSSVLAAIVAQVTRTPKQPNGVDVMAPFRLPYGIQRIRLQQGRARIEF
jgi:hypothetical protein